MPHNQTVLVLGAGASKPYGLPLGYELTASAVKFLEQHQLFKTDRVFTDHRHDVNGFANIARRLRRSRTPTVDHYIGQNGAAADKLKAAIAGVIWQAESEALDPAVLPEDDWISWLYHRAMERRPDKFSRNKLQVISFNYDRLPQALIATMMANTFEGISAEDALKILLESKAWESSPLPRFAHVHGHLNATLSHHRSTSGNKIDTHRLCNAGELASANSKWSTLCSTISTIHENAQEDSFAEKARKCIYSANRVVFIGFGFHSSNLARLGLDASTLERMQYRMNIDMSGSGIKVAGEERKRIQGIMGAKFRLGPADDTCVAFLERELAT